MLPHPESASSRRPSQHSEQGRKEDTRPADYRANGDTLFICRGRDRSLETPKEPEKVILCVVQSQHTKTNSSSVHFKEQP